MPWTLDNSGTEPVWKCTKYTDLQYVDIINLAEYGQPVSPYEPGYNHDFVPDFANIIIDMPQSEVMYNGYGKDITAESFPFVEKFLNNDIKVPAGTYSFDDLVRMKVATKAERVLKGHLYGGGNNGFTPGEISPADAAFIHGTVSVALMKGTRFIAADGLRRVEAEIGAMEDNWDFESKTVNQYVEAIVAVTLGPDHYNLEGPIRMRYSGPGKRTSTEKKEISRVLKEIAWKVKRAAMPMP